MGEGRQTVQGKDHPSREGGHSHASKASKSLKHTERGTTPQHFPQALFLIEPKQVNLIITRLVPKFPALALTLWVYVTATCPPCEEVAPGRDQLSKTGWQWPSRSGCTDDSTRWHCAPSVTRRSGKGRNEAHSTNAQPHSTDDIQISSRDQKETFSHFQLTFTSEKGDGR